MNSDKISDICGLPVKNIEAIQTVFSHYASIELAILYGSRAKGNFKAGSDIDLTLQAPELSLTDLLKIENELDDLLLPYKIDLSLLHHITNNDLIDHINRVGRQFYQKV